MDALNELLSDPVVDKCADPEAIHKFLAQVAYETGYYSTVYQPLDGGAGLIHMIPGNWKLSAQDMDVLWPGNDFAGKVDAMGKNFFQTAEYGWRSVAAWFKRTNRVIGGCGKDLFDQSYDEQTRCILSRVVDRKEAYDVVGRCMAQAPTTLPPTTQAPTTLPPRTQAPTTLPPSTQAPTTLAPTTQPPTSATTTQAVTSTTEPEPEPESTTPSIIDPRCQGCPGDNSCIWSDGICYPAMAQEVCEGTSGAVWCGGPEPEPEPESTTAEPEPESTTTVPIAPGDPSCNLQRGESPSIWDDGLCYISVPCDGTAPLRCNGRCYTPKKDACPQAPTPAPEPESTTPEPETTTKQEETTTARPVPQGGCVQNTDCGANAWCKDASYVAWCPAQGAWCPSPMCTMATAASAMQVSSREPKAMRKRAPVQSHGFLAPALVQAMAWLERVVAVGETTEL